MNKKKPLLLVILSVIAVFAMAFAVACGGNEDNVNNDDKLLEGNYEGTADVVESPADDWVLQSISLDVSQVKTTYNYGEEFNKAQKPVVTAQLASLESVIKYEQTKYMISGAEALELKTETVTDVTVDSDQFDKTAVGTYRIYVNYTHAGITRSASYEVSVVSGSVGVGGITVEAEEGFAFEYTIESTDGVNIEGLEKLHVFNVNSELVKGDEVAASDLTVEYYRNGTKIESVQGIKEKGDYTIMFKYNGASAFVTVSVADSIQKIEFLAEEEGTTLTQVQSPVDELTSTWKFKLTYSSTNEVVVEKGFTGLMVPNITTVLPVNDGVATVEYTEDGKTVSVNVNYNITKDEKLLNESEEFNRTALGLTSGDTNLTQSHLTGDNSFLKKGEASNVVLRYRAGTDSGCLEIRYDAVNVEFYGFGTLTVSVRSTGSSNKSSIALKSEDGKYITANYDSNDTGISEGTTNNGKLYVVTGDMQKDAEGKNIPYTARILTFVVPEAGVYTLCTVDEVLVDGDALATATNRNTRVYKIEKTDVFDNTIDRISYEFDINADAVKKDYVAGETELSKTGLTGTFKEIHSVDTDKNKTTNLTAEDLKIELTSGDLTKLNTKGTVTVTYTANGKDYTKTYSINIKSPVAIEGEDVNKVEAVKETNSYDLAKDQTTVEISKTDIVLHANSATGATITPAADKVEYKLFKGDEEQQSWTVGAGTYTIKITVVLENTKAAVPGTTEFTTEFNVTVKEWVAPTETSNYESFFIPNVDGTFTSTDYAANAEITDNGLFTMTAGIALKTWQGKDATSIQHNGGSNKVEFVDTKGTTHNPNVGIAATTNGSAETWFTVTAKENVKLTLYVTFANLSYNSNKSGTILYKVNGADGDSKALSARKDVWTVTVTLNKGDIVTFSTVNEANDGCGWLFGAEAEKV